MICFAGLLPESIRAEENIPVSESCSITFEIPNAYRAALKEQKLELRLYRIADITETGEYRDLEKYSGLNIQELSVESSAREYKKKQKMWRRLLELPNGMRVQRQKRMQRLN